MNFFEYINNLGSFQLLGVVGSFIYISSFACVQLGKMDGNNIHYSICNVLAASLVALSLTVEFNLASALIQYSWMVIGLIGLALRFHKKSSPQFLKMKFKDKSNSDYL